jgi:hypothetical protein
MQRTIATGKEAREIITRIQVQRTVATISLGRHRNEVVEARFPLLLMLLLQQLGGVAEEVRTTPEVVIKSVREVVVEVV